MELAFTLRPLLALICVLALIAGIAWVMKRYKLGQKFLHKTSGKQRITVEEIHMLDMKRRLVLIRRDNTGHLLLLGQGADIVVERNIDLTCREKGEASEAA